MLIDDPDDQGAGPVTMTFDFSATGPVSIRGLTIIDVELNEMRPLVELFDADGALVVSQSLDNTGDNGVNGAVMEPNSGVVVMRISARGSIGVDNILLAPRGACCFPQGTCEELTGEDCAAEGGSPNGDFVPCGSVDCTPPMTTSTSMPATGACCMPDGSCEQLTGDGCTDAGGSFNGVFTQRELVDCTPPPITTTTTTTTTIPPSPVVNFTMVMDCEQATTCTVRPCTGSGSGTFSLATDTMLMSYDISFINLSAAENVSHIHGPAEPGMTAGVQVDLPLGMLNVGEVTLTEQQQAEMLDELFYVNIHSADCPGGEIRGQILVEDDDPTPGGI